MKQRSGSQRIVYGSNCIPSYDGLLWHNHNHVRSTSSEILLASVAEIVLGRTPLTSHNAFATPTNSVPCLSSLTLLFC